MVSWLANNAPVRVNYSIIMLACDIDSRDCSNNTYSKGQKNRNDLHSTLWFENNFDIPKVYLKTCNDLGLLAPNRYQLDLPNEILNIYFGQGAVKISQVKVGGWKEICWFGPGRCRIGVESVRLGNFFFDHQLWTLMFLQPVNLKEPTVPHLKYLVHICLELKSQGPEPNTSGLEVDATSGKIEFSSRSN